ncbi:MAG: TonB-dependent receptor [Pseudomonadota bacterium]
MFATTHPFMFRLACAACIVPLSSSAFAQEDDKDSLQSDSSSVEEITVIGSRLPTQNYKLGNVVTSLDQQEIQSTGLQYGADVLRFVPGLAVNRTGGFGSLTQVRMRGAEGNHVLVLIDGVDVSAAGSGEFDFSSLLSGDLQRVQVLRGPQSGLYGSNALAGVISIETLDPAEGFQFSAGLEGGSNDVQQGMFSVSGGSERFKGRLSVLRRTSEFDLSSDDTLGAEDDRDENLTVSGKASYIASDALRFDFVARYADKDTETDGFDFSGGPLQGLAVDNNSFSNTKDLTLAARTTLSLYDVRWVTQFSLERTDSETDGGSFGSEADRNRIVLSSSWQWQDVGAVRQRTSIFLEDEDEAFRNTVPFDPSQVPERERNLFGYGIEHRVEWNDRLFLSGSLRRDENDAFQDQTTWSTALSWLANDTGTRVHASYGVGVTNPTFFEQFGFVPGQFVGNPDLVPEESEGWDIGIEQTLLDGSLVLDATYFDADLENEIQNLFPTVINADELSERSGVELSVNYRPLSGTRVRAAYTYTDADEPGGEEVRRPEHTASLLVDQSLLDDRLILGASVIYNGEQLDNDFRNFFVNFAAERTRVDAYTLVNLNARYRVSANLVLYARIENAFDEDYEEVISYATPGRSTYAGLRWRF